LVLYSRLLLWVEMTGAVFNLVRMSNPDWVLVGNQLSRIDDRADGHLPIGAVARAVTVAATWAEGSRSV